MTTSDHAKYCIAQLEQIRSTLYALAKHAATFSPKTGVALGVMAEQLKDWREVLEEHIPDEFDIGK